MDALLVALVLVVFVGVLQVALDARHRTARPTGPFWLRVECDEVGRRSVLDHEGRELRGVRAIQHSSAYDSVDELTVTVLPRTPDGRLMICNRPVGAPAFPPWPRVPTKDAVFESLSRMEATIRRGDKTRRLDPL